MSKKQITLLQTWNKIPSSPGHSLNSFGGDASTSVQALPSTNVSSPNVFQSPHYSRKPDELPDPEFDYEAGKTWIYPTNYPIRDYQYSIVKEALFKNTMVILPTGLGKTFIAAVVMFNIYRWFPNGKVVFMAPTKPLVAQQIDACFNITGIPQDDTTQMTGTNAPELRKRMWQRKRVFFLTPQVLVNDLVRNICPASTIKCLVVDEAHKALGNHAYCQVIKELCAYSSQFRVLALTATPGSETQAVKQVLSNLLISHVEMRSEDSEDVQKYTHIRDIEKIVVPLGEGLTTLKSRFLDVINIYLKRLTLRKVISAKNPTSLSKFQILRMREGFSQNPPGNIDRFTYGLVMADFALLISLYHAYELLLLHGATPFYNFLMGILNGDKSIPHAKNELMKNFEFEEIMEYVKKNYIQEPSNATEIQGRQNISKKNVLPGHPKLEKLLEVVLKHFQRINVENIPDTRVMIFTQYRDSVQEIVNLLNEYQPTIKAMSFVGQSSKTATSAGISQKQQLKVIQDFRSGGYNTLVSTCVGEEGLDIGEVDLIVCYDCPKSPIRLVQRMGRTGRLRKGRIVILIAEGKEEQMMNTCEYRKKTVHRAITKGFTFAQFYQNSPSLLPPGVKPFCVKTVLTIQKKKEEPKQKVVSKSPFLNDEEMSEFNQHVKVPQNEAPLLPNPEIIILKNRQENVIESTSAHPVKPQLSLQEWTLWQTTPQRTDMIPHSSKSLLLVKTLENIHFPELLSSKWASVAPDFDSFLDRSINHSITNNHSKSFSRQTKITECLSSPKPVDDDNIVVVASPPDIEVLDDIPDVEPRHLPKKGTLLEQLFHLKSFRKSDTILQGSDVRSYIRKPPPVAELSNIVDFSEIDVKLITRNEARSSSILRILNKKMKAKLKKKTIEHRRHSFHKSTLFFTPQKASSSPPNGVCKEVKTSLDIPFNMEPKSSAASEQNDFEGVQFDLNFDAADTFEDNLNFKEELDLKNIDNVCSKIENKLLCEEKKSDSINFDIGLDGIDYVLESEHLQKATFQNISSEFVKKTDKDNKLLESSKVLSEAEKDPPSNILNFDIGFKEKEEFLPSKKNEAFKFSAASSNEDKNKQEFVTKNLSNVEEKHSFDDSPELINFEDIKIKHSSILPDIHKEKQYSVLKDVKNISHVLIEDKTVDINKNLNHKKIPDRNFFESGIKSIQMLNSATNMFTKDLSNKNFVLPNNKSKDNIVNSHISSDQTGSKINRLQDIDEFSDFEESSCLKSKTFEKTPTTILYDVNDALEESTRHCVKRKLSTKEDNHKILNESKIIDEYSVGSRNKNMSLQTKQNIEVRDMDEIEEISNDCNFSFDASFFNEDLKPENHALPNKTDMTSEPTEIYALSKVDSTKNMDEFDKDANLILEQLFTSQKSVSCDLNSSFSSPLTVKRCISETGERKESGQKRKNCKTVEKKCPQPRNFKEGKSSDSILLETPITNSHLNADKVIEDSNVDFNRSKNINTSVRTLNKSVSLAELAEDPSQYTLTQLLTLIDCTENVEPKLEESHARSPKCLQDNSGVYNVSSEDEVCPTPPKEIVKPKSEFIYCKKAKIRKSLDFRKFENPHVEVRNTSSNLSAAALECKINPTPADSFAYQAINRQSISHQGSSGEALKNSTRCNSPQVTTLNHEKENNIIKDFESSPKFSFDISFALPFTQENFESPGKDVMNNAIIVESSSSEEQVTKNQNDDDFSASKSNFNDKNHSPHKVTLQNHTSNNIYHNLPKEDTHLFDIMTEDSESLLPSMPINVKTCDTAKTLEKHRVLTTSSNNSDFSNFKCVDTCHSGTESDKTKKELESKLVSNQDFFSNNSKNCQKSKENSNFVFLDATNSECNTKSNYAKGNVKKIIEDQDFKIQFKNAKHMLEEKNKNSRISSPQNALLSNELPDAKLSEDFTDEKICFDLGFDDETCNLLASDNNPIIASKRCIDIKVNNSLNAQAVSDQKLEYKKVMKKSIFEKNDESFNKMLCSEKSNCKLNNPNDELVLKFDLGKEDKDLLACERSYLSVSDKNSKHAASVLINHNSSEDFDFLDPNQTLKMVKPKDQNSKLVNKERIKMPEAGCSNQKMFENANVTVRDNSKSKVSSKLSRKAKINGKAVIKNNSAIEDEDDDFQFIQKIQKKIDPPASKRSKKKKFSSRNEFLFSQADVSGSDNSAHESSDDDNDHLEESFIDDESPHRLDRTEQHAFYLKSLKNTVGLPQKFKLKAIENNKYFGEPEVDNSKYELDSFCVSDEDVVFLSSDEELETKARPKKKHKSKNTKRKLKRIITHDSSASSEHEISPKLPKLTEKSSDERTVSNNAHNESIFVVRKRKDKVKIVSSDEEEYAFIKPSDVELKNRIEISSTEVPGTHAFESKKTINDCNNLCFELDDDIQFLSEIKSDGIASVKQKPVEPKMLNDIEIFLPNDEPSTSKHVNPIPNNVNCFETSTTDCPMGNIEFDIGWDEIGTSTSDNNVGPSTPNKIPTSFNSVNSAKRDVPSAILVDSRELASGKPVISSFNSVNSDKKDVPSVILVDSRELASGKPVISSFNSVNSDKKDVPSVILVDSRELASGKPVISSLRNIFKVNPIVMQLPSADYVISNRIAIERILDSEFNQCNMPPRIVEKIKEMNGIYEKSFIIIEKDNRKNRLSFNKNITKYLQFIVHLHCNRSFKVLFSKSADHSSEMIANLVQQERRRSFHIDVPVTLNDQNRKVFNFYSSFPKMSPVCALNFMYYFPTIDMLFKSSVEDIKKKGCISSHKASRLYKYLRSELVFHENL